MNRSVFFLVDHKLLYMLLLINLYAFFRLGQFWNVGDKLGEASKHLRAPVQAEGNSQQSLHSEELPPAKGWQYNDRFVNVWSDDSTMELGVPSPPCRTVLVELTGDCRRSDIICAYSWTIRNLCIYGFSGP